MKAEASSTWTGNWKQGRGTISTKSPVLKTVPFSYSSRFEEAAGANPEELLAAAHAGCFNQALANNFGMNGLEAIAIDTHVSIVVHQGETGSPTIETSDITVRAQVPGCTQEVFDHCAERARSHCSISSILKREITLKATLLV